MARIEAQEDGVLIPIRLSPRASRDCVRGEHDGRIKITLTSPPFDNRANDHLKKFLSKILKVPRSDISIVEGAKSRNKLVRVLGSTPDLVKSLLSQ